MSVKLANHGRRWTVEHEKKILDSVAQGIARCDIATDMQRSVGSINSRLCQLACTAIENGKSIEEAIEMTGLTQNIIEENLSKRIVLHLSKNTLSEPKESQETKPVQSNNFILNEEQQEVITNIKSGRNIFLTGGAGVGKSTTLQYVLNWAHSENYKVGLCAMTGTAAILIDGNTLHSFMGIGLAKEDPQYLVNRIKYNNTVYTKLVYIDMLIIDEASMLNDELFEKVSKVLSLIKKNPAPFGGLQIILVGDPFQLCPVTGKYCFLSDEWKRSNFKVCLLKKHMRQKDPVFQQLLDRLRWGECSSKDLETLNQLKNTVFPDSIIPTKLYAINKDVERINIQELEKLVKMSGVQIHSYFIKYGGNKENTKKSMKWVQSNKLPEEIKLCIGAQVMLTRNMDVEAGLVNGARGVILNILSNKSVQVKFMSVNKPVVIEYYKVQLEDNPDIAVSYMPLRLAWAITTHRSQGMSLDAVEIDLGSSIFADGQAYTAISRARDMKSVRLIDVKASSFKTSPDVISFYKTNV